MSKKGLKKKTQNNLKIYKFSPDNVINGAKKNIKNFFQNLKKDRERNKLKIEKEKKIQEKKEIQQQFNASYKLYQNNINLIEIRKKNLLTSEKFFAISKEQFYQGQLSSNDFREAQIALSLSKNILNQTLYKAKIAELNLYRLSGKILQKTNN